MAWILVLSAVAQISPSSYETVRADLEFVRRVEEFVIAAQPGHRPPEPYGGLIERLGDTGWRERESASEQLKAASVSDQRWLFWGRVHPDPEVRLRSNALLRRMNPCATCRGSGSSKNWELWPCPDCQGTATAWPWSAWD